MLWGDVFQQLPPHKDTLIMGLGTEVPSIVPCSGSHHCPAPWAARESQRRNAVQGRAIWEDKTEGSGAQFHHPDPVLLLRFIRKESPLPSTSHWAGASVQADGAG